MVNVSEWTSSAFNPEKILNELQTPITNQIDQVIVKGNNFKGFYDENLIKSNVSFEITSVLNGNISYEYVGFRYVSSYKGRRSE